MTLAPQAVKYISRLLLFCLIAVEIYVSLIYFISSLLAGKAFAGFDFDTKGTIPSLFSACQLFLLGLPLLVVAYQQRNLLQRRSLRSLIILGAGFVCLAIDKLFNISDLIQQLPDKFTWIPQFKSGIIAWIFLCVVIRIIFVIYRDLVALWNFYRQGTFITILGISIFLFGIVGIEIINYHFLQPEVSEMQQRRDSMVAILYPLKDTIEEFLEMLGQSIALYGLSLLWVRYLEKARANTQLLKNG